MRNEASFAGIFGELLSLLTDARRELLLYTLVVGGLTAVGVLAGWTETTAGSLSYGFEVDASDTVTSALFEIAAAIVSVVGTYILLTRFLAVRGRLRVGSNRFWHYLGMAILSAIAMVLGLFLLIVPGIILLVRWSAASGFVIGAGEGISESLSSSWEATRGHSWAIFFAAVVLFFGLIVCGGLVGGVFGLISDDVVGVVSAFVEAAAGAVFAAFGIAVYCLVHDDGQEISEVFA